ncbi:MAG: hypothetical protein IPJ19_09245 [Planctomycetes bacterium]|nr:hypothetical protein [Planctomycetota bacterium]
MIPLELADGNDAHVFGRILAADTRAGVGGAMVALVADGACLPASGPVTSGPVLASVSTSSDGSFEFDYPLWRAPHLRVEATGFGVVLAAPVKECADAARPLLIELARSSRLRAHVLDTAGQPRANVEVSILAQGNSLLLPEQEQRSDLPAGLPTETWSSKTDREGWVSFSDLPAQIPLEAALQLGTRSVRLERDDVRLAPGEAREVEWRVESGCTLTGIALAEDGQPVSSILLWLAPASVSSSPYFSTHTTHPAQSTSTDKSGRFALSGVPAGDWLLGPAPGLFAKDWRIAPVPTPVRVGIEGSQKLTVLVPRGYSILGAVLDPDGKPAPGARIEIEDEEHRPIAMDCSAESSGFFAVGPLPPRTLFLKANSFSCLDSPVVRAAPGDRGVELKLQRGGTLSGRVIDSATGEGCMAALEYTLEGSSDRPTRGWASGWPAVWTQPGITTTGGFQSPAFSAGTYSIGARTDDGRFGVVKGLSVAIGEAHTDVVLRLSPGGVARITYTGKREALWATVLLDGVATTEPVRIERNRPRRLAVPAGTSALALRAALDGPARTRRIELETGETKEITLTDED